MKKDIIRNKWKYIIVIPVVIYLLISQVNLSKVPWPIWTFVSMFNIMSVGFFLYNLIVCIGLSKRKNISN